MDVSPTMNEAVNSHAYKCVYCKKRNTYACPYRTVKNQVGCSRYYEPETNYSSINYFDYMRSRFYGSDWLQKLNLIDYG